MILVLQGRRQLLKEVRRLGAISKIQYICTCIIKHVQVTQEVKSPWDGELSKIKKILLILPANKTISSSSSARMLTMPTMLVCMVC